MYFSIAHMNTQPIKKCVASEYSCSAYGDTLPHYLHTHTHTKWEQVCQDKKSAAVRYRWFYLKGNSSWIALRFTHTHTHHTTHIHSHTHHTSNTHTLHHTIEMTNNHDKCSQQFIVILQVCSYSFLGRPVFLGTTGRWLLMMAAARRTAACNTSIDQSVWSALSCSSTDRQNSNMLSSC